jgi:hypothetical protein
MLGIKIYQNLYMFCISNLTICHYRLRSGSAILLSINSHACVMSDYP